MTAKTFKWNLWTHQEDVHMAFDEFTAEGFRVRLMGPTLDVTFEAPGTRSPDLATSLAEKYVEILAKHLGTSITLLTEGEWLERTAPPFGRMRTLHIDRDGRRRVVSAMRSARNELLASEDKTLRRCYDYLQDARERAHTDEAAYDAYKAIEVLEGRFGTQKKAVDALGKILKKAKTAANEKRHIPEEGRLQPKGSDGPVELTKQAIREYERYLLGQRFGVRKV